MNGRLYSRSRSVHALNMVDSALTTFKEKGNLGYVNELYNPKNFFEQVHHVTFFPEDSSIELENKTIKVHVLKRAANKMWHPANVPLFLLQIIEIAIKNRISVIRGRSIGLAGFLGLLTGKILGIPFVVSLGGNNRLDRELTYIFGKRTTAKILKKTFADLVEIFILQNADCIIVPNVYTKNYAISMKAHEKKIEIVSWILKRDVFDRSMDKAELNRFVKQFHLDFAKPIVLYVGRLEPAKQVDMVMESIPFILKETTDAQFVFIGDGSLWEWLKERANRLNVAEKVHFLGYQSTDVIKAFLSVSSVVWIPMSGFVVFEAAAFSAPIVAFDVEWHHEFIVNEVNGLLVENRNHRKMAEAVIKMLNDQALARRYGEAARRKLMEEYNPEALRKKEIEIYKRILDKSFKT